MTTWFIIDTRIGEIVNACEGSGLTREKALAPFGDKPHLDAKTDPPLAMLKRYRYWDERP